MRIHACLVACLLFACNRQIESAPDDGGAVSQGPPTDGSSTPTDGGTSFGCGACNTPPDACHAVVGTCQAGVCVYDFVDNATCDDGNPCTVADTCTSGACLGTPMTCHTPPTAVCLDSSQTKTYDQQGLCTGGLCAYNSHTVSCGSGGCAGGHCATDPCASISCGTPPSVCYAAAGVCSQGSCSYAFADGVTCDDGDACTTVDQCGTGTCQGVPKSCATPPANTCANATTLRSYTSSGSCQSATGTCSYAFAYVTCANGCVSGSCMPSGWKVMTSNTTTQLNSVWGSSSSAIWAVGLNGTLLFYDGTQWQVHASPSAAVGKALQHLYGTSAQNVFLVAGLSLLRFDGTSWTTYADLTTALGGYSITGIHALGDSGNHVYISTNLLIQGISKQVLWVVDHSGTVSLVTGGDDPQFSICYAATGGVWAFSTTDIVFTGCWLYDWNGSALGNVGPVGQSTTAVPYTLWAASPSAIFGVAGVGGSESPDVSIWDGTSWTTTSTGLSGQLMSVWGTAGNRVFLAGHDTSKNAPAIVYYDATGFTAAVLPASTSTLFGIWAATSGEVFAVGSGGLILTGP